jgi:choline monooxygenase
MGKIKPILKTSCAMTLDQGRQALMQRGDNQVGPYQSPMEDGMQHFHEWYLKRMSVTA